MQNLLSELTSILTTDKRLVVDGHLLKNKIIELALANDPSLLKLLQKNETIKRHFFTRVENVLVFDKARFHRFVSNKQFLPDSYTAFKNKIGITDDEGSFISESRSIALSWPYKDCVLEGGQTKEEQSREEVFWNETLAPDEIDRLLEPKVLTKFKLVDSRGEHTLRGNEILDLSKANLLIRGNNLLALHSLSKVVPGKVRLIYIDPPYGKDTDTFYNDDFLRSTWLTFMKNRLEIAKTLLAPGGLLFIQITYHNLAHLKLLCDEIFKNGLVNILTVKVRSTSGFKVVNPGCFVSSEYILVYAKSGGTVTTKKIFIEDDYDLAYSVYIPNKSKDCSKWKLLSVKEKVAQDSGYKSYRDLQKEKGRHKAEQLLADFALENADKVCQLESIGHAAGKETLELKKISLKHRGRVFSGKSAKEEVRYVYNGRELAFYSKKLREINGKLVPASLLTDIWRDISWEGIGSEGGVSLNRGKKPERLIQRIIDLSTESTTGGIVLDFFAGSGTTPAVAHKLGLQYIGIEQIDYGSDDCFHRLKNVIKGDKTGISDIVGWEGGGSFIYCELLEWNEEFAARIKKARTSKEITRIWEIMQQKAFLSYRVDPSTINENIKEFKNLSLPNQKRFLIEALDHNHLYVNYSDIDDTEFKVSAVDKRLNRAFYGGV